MLTVAEARSSRINRVSGVCAGSEEWFQILNDATRELMRRGNWWGTIQTYHGCIYNGCITWMRPVGTVLALNRCGHPVPPKNRWGAFNAVLPDSPAISHWRRTGQFLCARDIALADQNTSPVFNQIPCNTPRFLRFYITQPIDAGKTITVFGKVGGIELITTRADGTIQPGLVIPLAIPFVETSLAFNSIERVIKDVTDGPVYGYQFDGTNIFPMAVYMPKETLPDYRTDRLIASACATTHCSQFPSQIEALVKLQFIPAQTDDDLILIDNIDALALAMQGVKLGDAYDAAGKVSMMALAIKELNMDLRDKFPVDQTPVQFKPFGTASLARAGIGRMM